MSTKYLDLDGLSRFWAGVKSLINGKVDKETGKGLSTNDYTTAEKNKLASLVDTSVANATQYNSHSNGSLSTTLNRTKTYTISGSGIVFVTATLRTGTNTWGTTKVAISHNNTDVSKATDIITSSYDGQEIAASTSAFLKVSNGDTISVLTYSTRYTSGNTWDAYYNLLAFGCTLTSN